MNIAETFEGLALGSRIAALQWAPKAYQPWLMAFAYGCTTPIGQALGLATHTLYSPGSQVGLLMVGIMNAISAGLLTFTSLVDLMSEDFLSDESWRVLKGRKRVWACGMLNSALQLGSCFLSKNATCKEYLLINISFSTGILRRILNEFDWCMGIRDLK